MINELSMRYQLHIIHTGKLPVNRPILSGRDSGNLRTTLVTMLLLLSTLTKIQSIILDV
jgi:hypothetical protein